MDETNEALTNIQRMIRLYDSMLKSVCEKFRLTLVEATIISFFHNNPERDTASDVVEYRMLSKSHVSQAIEGLIQKGYLVRKQDTEDRRKIHIALTSKIEPITEEIEDVRGKFRKHIFRGFSEDEIKMLFRFVERLAQNL